MSRKQVKVLVLGAGGMLGHKLIEVLSQRFEVAATCRRRPEFKHPALAGADLRAGVDADDFDTMIEALADTRPNAVVNCIGIVKQRAEAKSPIPSIKINALFPHRLASLCRNSGARLIHISTDCVFSGEKGNYLESDEPDAHDLYGRTKFLGEVGGPGALTLRTSIIGRELSVHSGLVDWFLSQRGRTVRGFANAIFTGFTTKALADIIGDVLEKHGNLEGLWQVSSDPINKYDLLNLLNREMRLETEILRDDEFRCDRSLNSDRFRKATGFQPPSWPEMIASLAEEAKDYPALGRGAKSTQSLVAAGG